MGDPVADDVSGVLSSADCILSDEDIPTTVTIHISNSHALVHAHLQADVTTGTYRGGGMGRGTRYKLKHT